MSERVRGSVLVGGTVMVPGYVGDAVLGSERVFGMVGDDDEVLDVVMGSLLVLFSVDVADTLGEIVFGDDNVSGRDLVLVILWVSVGRCVSVGGGVFVIGRELLLDTFGDGVGRCVFVAVSVILGVTLGVFFMVFVGKEVLELVAVMRLVLEGVTAALLDGVTG